MKKFLLCIAFICFLLIAAHSLYAGEKRRDSSAAFGINAATGNTESLFVTFGVDTVSRGYNDMFRAGLEGSYGERDGDTSAKEIVVSSQYNRDVMHKTFWTVSGSFEHNEIADIDYRYIIAPGYGIYFIKDEKRIFEISAGFAYVGQQFISGGDENYISANLFERFEFKTANSKFWQSFLFLPEIEDLDNFLLKAELGFDAGLTERWGLRLVLRNVYDNSPRAGMENNDLSLMSMLTLRL